MAAQRTERKIFCLVMGGHVYLNPWKEEATLRCRLEVPELSVARAVVPQFLEMFGSKLPSEEFSLLKKWGEGYGLSRLNDLFDNTELFESTIPQPP